jgi:hypothetical protein
MALNHGGPSTATFFPSISIYSALRSLSRSFSASALAAASAFLVTNVWRELEGQQIGWLERFSLLLGTTGSRNESEHRFEVLPDFYADGHHLEPLAA